MRKLIIILAVFVLLFVAVLVWGVARDRDGPVAEGGQDVECKGPPKKKELNPETNQIEETIDLDRMNDWRKKCVGKAIQNAANRFTPGTLFDPPNISLAGKGATASRELNAIDDEDKIRVVKLVKASGGAIEVTTEIDGEDQELCLCEPGDRLRDKDDNRICKVSVKGSQCPEDSTRGSFAVNHEGASFTFTSLFKAEARSTKK